jgi:hypothetical protein
VLERERQQITRLRVKPLHRAAGSQPG